MTLFLLHHTKEGRIGLCHEDDGHLLPKTTIICAMPFEHVVGLYDDINESFLSLSERIGQQHPDEGGEDDGIGD